MQNERVGHETVSCTGWGSISSAGDHCPFEYVMAQPSRGGVPTQLLLTSTQKDAVGHETDHDTPPEGLGATATHLPSLDVTAVLLVRPRFLEATSWGAINTATAVAMTAEANSAPAERPAMRRRRRRLRPRSSAEAMTRSTDSESTFDTQDLQFLTAKNATQLTDPAIDVCSGRSRTKTHDLSCLSD
jgi:hypothetical protein